MLTSHSIFGKYIIEACKYLGNTLWKHTNSILRSVSEGSVIVFQAKYVQNNQMTKKKIIGSFGWKKNFLCKKRSFENLARKISGYGSEMIFGPPNPRPSVCP